MRLAVSRRLVVSKIVNRRYNRFFKIGLFDHFLGVFGIFLSTIAFFTLFFFFFLFCIFSVFLGQIAIKRSHIKK
jgi:hypothetical protein